MPTHDHYRIHHHRLHHHQHHLLQNRIGWVRAKQTIPNGLIWSMIILSSYLDAIVPNKPILILTSHHQVSQTPRTTLPFSLKRSILHAMFSSSLLSFWIEISSSMTSNLSTAFGELSILEKLWYNFQVNFITIHECFHQAPGMDARLEHWRPYQ